MKPFDATNELPMWETLEGLRNYPYKLSLQIVKKNQSKIIRIYMSLFIFLKKKDVDVVQILDDIALLQIDNAFHIGLLRLLSLLDRMKKIVVQIVDNDNGNNFSFGVFE